MERREVQERELEVRGDFLQQRTLGLGTYQTSYDLTILEKEQRRDTHDRELGRRGYVDIDVELANSEFV